MDYEFASTVNHDADYETLLGLLKINFKNAVSGNNPLFRVNCGENLFDIFLNNIPADVRQVYNCNACRHFVNKYGSLVTIDDAGHIETAVWNTNVPAFFHKSIALMRKAVLSGKVIGMFISDTTTLGIPVTGEWKHMSVELPISMVSMNLLKTPDQLMAEKREERKMLQNAMLAYTLDTAKKAYELLKFSDFYRADKVVDNAEWFYKLYKQCVDNRDSNVKNNLVWKAIATAPAGWCHINSGMLGSLLDDVKCGYYTVEAIKRRFEEKMNPTNYMRSTAAPTTGNVEQAEKIVERLGIANSLVRRYARIDEIPCNIWTKKGTNAKTEVKSTGVFADIAPKKSEPENVLDIPAVKMTWEKFSRNILPDAESIEVLLDNPNRFMALVTAFDESAPNILQWNNPFSWYYHGGIDGEMKRRVENAGGQYEDNEIRCTLMWDSYTDLDLHCVFGNYRDEIYYSNKRVGDGYLDVDANGGSPTTMKPVENIRWKKNAPNGHYQFYVHNYSDRNHGDNPFTIELCIAGKTYTVSDNIRSSRSNHTIFEFDYKNGVVTNLNVKGNSKSASASEWSIPQTKYAKVNMITNSPNLWDNDENDRAGHHIFFILDNFKDASEGKGRGFFNETLKPELREVRKTLEAYTAKATIRDAENATACGVGYSKDSDWNLVLQVKTNGANRRILIDRFD